MPLADQARLRGPGGDFRVGQPSGDQPLSLRPSLVGAVSADTDGGTAVALAAMHLVVGVAVVAALEVARRRS